MTAHYTVTSCRSGTASANRDSGAEGSLLHLLQQDQRNTYFSGQA